MSGAHAAAYCGVTVATFARWVSEGRVPKPLPGTRRWDRKAIDLALDKASGIPAVPISQHDLEQQKAEQWCRDYDARVAAKLLTRNSSGKKKQEPRPWPSG
jgi:hypothetical protein